MVVITPSLPHAEVTVAALDRGLPVLCEKPMATTVEDANRMIEASRKSGKLDSVGPRIEAGVAALRCNIIETLSAR